MLGTGVFNPPTNETIVQCQHHTQPTCTVRWVGVLAMFTEVDTTVAHLRFLVQIYLLINSTHF